MEVDVTELHLVIDWKNHFSTKEIKHYFDKYGLTLQECLVIKKLKKREATMSQFYNMPVNDFRGETDFNLYLIKDTTPNYNFRQTSKGENMVNVNMFDLKKDLRAIVGGFNIHATDNIQETKSNLRVLNLEKYYTQRKFASIEEVIKALTNCKNLKYVLPHLKTIDEIEFDEFNDIDFLTNNYFLFQSAIDAVEKPKGTWLDAVSNGGNSVRNYVWIDNVHIPIDIRFEGDNYFDTKWQKSVLNSGTIEEFNNFPLPNAEDDFYLLLYHGLIHKKQISEKVQIKLNYLAKKIGIEFESGSIEEAKKLLSIFMKKNGYEFVVPDDESVLFNQDNIDNELLPLSFEKQGVLLSSSRRKLGNDVFFCSVYDFQNTIVKIGTNPIPDNEKKYLDKLKISKHFPEVLSFESKNNISKVTMEKLSGVHLRDIYQYPKLWKKKILFDLLEDSVKILLALAENNILHRDIRPENILVSNKHPFELMLIDFGWSSEIDNPTKHLIPGLGADFKLREGVFSDAYSFGLCLRFNLSSLRFTHEHFNALLSLKEDAYADRMQLIHKLNEILLNIQQKRKQQISMKDNLLLVYRRLDLGTKMRKAIGVNGVQIIKKVLGR